jgi:hypothetical protein
VEGVPEQFFDERDSARFRHLAQLPGWSCTMRISPVTPLNPTPTKPSVLAQSKRVPNAFAIAVAVRCACQFRCHHEPDELHTGEAETADGWRYRMIYLDPRCWKR